MKRLAVWGKWCLPALLLAAGEAKAQSQAQLERQVELLQQQTVALQKQLAVLQSELKHSNRKGSSTGHHNPQTAHRHANDGAVSQPKAKKAPAPPMTRTRKKIHDAALSVHTISGHPESIGFYPTALIADDQVVTYIAGTPVVTSPYLGARPAFDGSDYIVNISSINRDIRLMQQRRRLYRAYQDIGYPVPNMPIIALSGKSEPIALWSQPYEGSGTGDLNLGSTELDVAAALNQNVEAFIGIAYDSAPPPIGGQRTGNSRFELNLGFINIGNLDATPFYFSAGQLFAPFGRYTSSMLTSPLPLLLGRTKTRPFILGYKTQDGSGPYAAAYAFRSDTTKGRSGVGGINLGYALETGDTIADYGFGLIGNIANSQSMQINGAPQGFFGGFASQTNGTENVGSVPGLDIHGAISIDRYNFTAEWVTANRAFAADALSFNGLGAKPSAGQVEASVTFKAFSKPASFGLGYQWSREALALNLPIQSYVAAFNISLWKDTVETLEFRHDIDYGVNNFANGAAPEGVVNTNIPGTGRSSDGVLAQIGLYF